MDENQLPIHGPIGSQESPSHPAAAPRRAIGRGIPQYPLAVALLNLTGLGLGYLYMRCWIRWAIYFPITVGLLVVGYLTNVTAAPFLALSLSALWLAWMVFDGGRYARRLVRAGPALPPARRWIPTLVAVLLLGLEGAGIWGYVTLGQREYVAGATAYRLGDCRTALGHFIRATTFYRPALGPAMFTADDELTACSLLVYAENALGQGDYAEATAGYEAYLARYPNSPIEAPVRERAAGAYAAWADALGKAGDYAAAVESCLVVLSDYSDTEVGERMPEQVAAIYMEWARDLQEAGAYDRAVTNYLILLNEYPDTRAGKGASERLMEAYAAWAAALRQEARYADAIRKYQAILNAQPEMKVASEAREAVAATYVEWAEALWKEEDYEGAIERYETVLNDYPTTGPAQALGPRIAQVYVLWAEQAVEQEEYEAAITRYGIVLDRYAGTPAAAEAREGIAAAYFGWAAQLRRQGQFVHAIEKYTLILNDYADTEAGADVPVAMGQAYNEWGSDLLERSKFTAAMEQFTQAQQVTDDPGVVSTAKEGYNQALWALSQDSRGEGKEVLQQALEEVCAGRSASSPAVGLAEEEPGKALVCAGSDIDLPVELKAIKPAHFRYVVSIEEGTSTVERCDYTYLGCTGWFCPTTHVLVRQREWWRVRVRDTRTARVVAERTFYGPQPRACEETESFSPAFEKYVSGGSPSTRDVLSWLTGVIR